MPLRDEKSEWLDMVDLVRLTTLSAKTIRRMIGRGQFPAPMVLADGVKRWPASDLEWWRLGMNLRHRLKAEKTDELNRDTEGHRGSQRDKRGAG